MAGPVVDSLLTRMADQATSWDAHREAEKLADASIIPPVAERIGKERKRGTRADLYFILGHVGRNTGDQRAAETLLGRLAAETDKHVLAGLLDALGRQTRLVECSAIVPLTHEPRWLVRHSAICALGSCPLPEAEEALLAVLDSSRDRFDLTYANAALGRIGTARAIPALTRMVLHGPAEDVRTSALAALAKLGDASIVPVFLEALGDRNGHVKRYAITGILKHGDERAVPSVIGRVKQITSRVRKQEGTPSELVQALTFLLRYASTDERVPALLRMIRAKRMDRLFPEERSWVEQQTLGQ